MHLEVINSQATAAAANGSAGATAAGENTLQIKADKGRPSIVQFWQRNQTAGFAQIAFPSGHDTTRGWRHAIPANEVTPRLADGVRMPIDPQETITHTIGGTAVAGDVESGVFTVLYEDLPGIKLNGIRFAEMQRRIEALTTIQSTLAGAAAGYTGAELITADSDLLRANREYAVLGITSSIECAAVCLRGPDTGGQRVACPGDSSDQGAAMNFFARLARAQDLPLIPVLNSANKANTFLDFIQDENNISPLVTVHLALLKR